MQTATQLGEICEMINFNHPYNADHPLHMHSHHPHLIDVDIEAHRGYATCQVHRARLHNYTFESSPCDPY